MLQVTPQVSVIVTLSWLENYELGLAEAYSAWVSGQKIQLKTQLASQTKTVFITWHIAAETENEVKASISKTFMEKQCDCQATSLCIFILDNAPAFRLQRSQKYLGSLPE